MDIAAAIEDALAAPDGLRTATRGELAAAIGGTATATSGTERDGARVSGADRGRARVSGNPAEVARIRRRDAILLAIAYIVLAAVVAGGIYLMYGRG